MDRYLATHDFKREWSQAAASDGMRRGNLLDSMTEYWITNWLIANGKTRNTRAQAQGLKNQLGSVLAKDRTVSRLTNAQRQELAEVWMINTIAQAGGYQTALKQGDTPMIDKAREAAVTRFRNEVKFDLRSLILTDRGFAKT